MGPRPKRGESHHGRGPRFNRKIFLKGSGRGGRVSHPQISRGWNSAPARDKQATLPLMHFAVKTTLFAFEMLQCPSKPRSLCHSMGMAPLRSERAFCIFRT